MLEVGAVDSQLDEYTLWQAGLSLSGSCEMPIHPNPNKLHGKA